MRTLKSIFVGILLFSVMIILGSCEQYNESADVNGLIKRNDLSLSLKVQDGSGGSITEKIYENGDDYYLKIEVKDTYSLRGETVIEPGHSYKLTFVLKNTSADPVINYSFWQKPKTSLRHYTFKGENGNPPSSETQTVSSEWRTFEEIFETLEGEDSFSLTLHCGKGIFYIEEISIELIP